MPVYKQLGKLPLDTIITLLEGEKDPSMEGVLALLKAGKSLPLAFANLLDEWLDAQIKKANATPPNNTPVADPNEEPQIDMKEHERKQNELIARRSKEAELRSQAVARLRQYEVEQGLLNTERNQQTINKFLLESPSLKEWRERGSVLSPAIIDNAISWLRNQLEFKKAEPPKPVVQAEPPKKLKDGSDQLPLGTVPSFSHSKEQLRDLAQRTLEATGMNKNRHGWHGGGRI